MTHFDVVVVGAGIVGLGAALAAHDRGLRVAVVDRATGVNGSSIRNFGHVGVTGQSGEALGYALASREIYLSLAERAGLWVSQRGAAIVARGDDELALLAAFAEERGSDQVVLAGVVEMRERTPVRDPAVTGGAFLPLDLQVDPRAAAPTIAAWLEAQGVAFFWGRSVLGIETGVVHTAAGELRAETVVVAVNFDVDQFYPEIAAGAGLRRCGLDMLSVDWNGRRPLDTPLLTGSSMLRYSGFASVPSAASMRERLRRESPELLQLDINQMYTERPDGTLVIGDTHHRGTAVPPFQSERDFAVLERITAELFDRPIRLRQRWQGVYASAPQDFLIESPAAGVHVVAVTTGIGMTTGLGLGETVINGIFGSGREQ